MLAWSPELWELGPFVLPPGEHASQRGAAMTAGEADKVGNDSTFGKTLVRVLVVQVVALVLLWALQAHYHVL
jgi:hypothetical protein